MNPSVKKVVVVSGETLGHLRLLRHRMGGVYGQGVGLFLCSIHFLPERPIKEPPPLPPIVTGGKRLRCWNTLIVP